MPDRDRLIFHIDVNSAFFKLDGTGASGAGRFRGSAHHSRHCGGRYFTRLAWYWQIHPRQGLRYHYGGACGQRPAEMSSSGHGLSGSFHVPRKKPAAHGTSVRYLPGH